MFPAQTVWAVYRRRVPGDVLVRCRQRDLPRRHRIRRHHARGRRAPGPRRHRGRRGWARRRRRRGPLRVGVSGGLMRWRVRFRGRHQQARVRRLCGVQRRRRVHALRPRVPSRPALVRRPPNLRLRVSGGLLLRRRVRRGRELPRRNSGSRRGILHRGGRCARAPPPPPTPRA